MLYIGAETIANASMTTCLVQKLLRLWLLQRETLEPIEHLLLPKRDIYSMHKQAAPFSVNMSPCRVQNGNTIGRELVIVDMPGERLGRLSVCSQPLITHREWLREWVDYQFQIGADEVFMHVPKVRS